uniref:Transmembrane protein n=1 Tax=Fagus sylvatica TaxID=28930 RepID=A0A2N9HBF0_FAGSY
MEICILELSSSKGSSFSLPLSPSQLPLARSDGHENHLTLRLSPSHSFSPSQLSLSLSLPCRFYPLSHAVSLLSDIIRPPASLLHAHDGGGFGLPIWWWGLGYGVVGVVVVAVGGLLVDGFVLRVCGFGSGDGDGGGVALGLGLGWGGRMGLGWGVCGVLGLGYGVAGIVMVAVGGLLVDGFVLRVWVP